MTLEPNRFTRVAFGFGVADLLVDVDRAACALRRIRRRGPWACGCREQRQQVIQAARELDMMVVPEGGSLLQHNLSMVVDGHTTLEHSLPAAKLYDDVKQLWQQSETAYTPTLVVAYGGIWGENYWYDKTEVWKHPRLSKYVPMDELRPRSMRRPTAPD